MLYYKNVCPSISLRLAMPLGTRQKMWGGWPIHKVLSCIWKVIVSQKIFSPWIFRLSDMCHTYMHLSYMIVLYLIYIFASNQYCAWPCLHMCTCVTLLLSCSIHMYMHMYIYILKYKAEIKFVWLCVMSPYSCNASVCIEQ